MFHIPIVNTDNERKRIEFSHIINNEANENTWKDSRNISLDNLKINVFVRGDFSLVVENECYVPVYGDFCVLPPHRVHYGRITKPTELEYYQLDIGIDAFCAVPGGSELLLELSDLSRTLGTLVRPEQATGELLLADCAKIASRIEAGDFTLAFVYTVELISGLKMVYGSSHREAASYLSKHVSRAIRYINEGYSQPISVAEIAALCRVSPTYLSRRFKSEIGVSVHDYITNLRITKATKLLLDTSVAQTAASVGFCDSSHFISVFKKKLGMTPSEYLKRH